MKDAFSLGIRSTQLCESLNKDLKNYLKSDLDIVRFFEHFERVVADKREKETISEYEYRRKVPRCKLNVPILLQLSTRYTPKIFELFQLEYELSMACQVEFLGENVYIVRVCGMDKVESKCCKVTWNPDDEKVSCSCMKFERWGILCCHGLRVLDIKNFKFLPKKYVLERWTHEARNNIVCDKNGITVVDTKLDLARRNRDLCRKFTRIAAKACTTEETSLFLDGILDKVDKEIDKKLSNNPKSANSNCNTNAIPDCLKNLVKNPPRLKKKNTSKRRKRHTSWVEDMPQKQPVTQKSSKKISKKKPATHNSSKNDELSSTFDKGIEINDANCNTTGEVRCAATTEACQQSGLKSFTEMLMDARCDVWHAPFDLFDDDVNLVRE